MGPSARAMGRLLELLRRNCTPRRKEPRGSKKGARRRTDNRHRLVTAALHLNLLKMAQIRRSSRRLRRACVRGNLLPSRFSRAGPAPARHVSSGHLRSLNIPRQTRGTLAEIAEHINPLLFGWISYHGHFSSAALATVADYVNQKLKALIMRKFKRFRFHKTRADFSAKAASPAMPWHSCVLPRFASWSEHIVINNQFSGPTPMRERWRARVMATAFLLP